MKIFKLKTDLQQHLDTLRSHSQKIGFVPTMGALHEGHLSLISEAKKQSDQVVCSIFVNPTQFNDPKDLERYPRPIEDDIALLESVGCDILFMPSAEEMYPENDEPWHIDLGDLDSIWEGEHRPGHFQGVTQVVYKLFTLVQPDIAFFGQKDFQQIMVIQRMVEIKGLPVRIISVPIIRGADGLALSSRNTRLSEQGLQSATILFKALNYVRDSFGKADLAQLEDKAKQIILANDGFSVEYLAICEAKTLKKATEVKPEIQYVVLVAAWLEGVRLIDNMLLN